ncbi:MAG: hypothetical protein QXU18_07040 [Thermoplasmatales archaeon]
MSNLYWDRLKGDVLNKGLVSEHDLEKINKRVRDLGNFAAHLGIKQIGDRLE